MQTPLRTLGVFNSSYSSYCCLNLGCTSYRNPINISTVGIIRSHAWIMDSLINKNRDEFVLLQDDIMFSSFKRTDLGKRILHLARTYIRIQYYYSFISLFEKVSKGGVAADPRRGGSSVQVRFCVTARDSENIPGDNRFPPNFSRERRKLV